MLVGALSRLSSACAVLQLTATASRTVPRASSSCTSTATPLHTSRLLRRKDPSPKTKLDVANMLGTTTHTFEGTSPLELNLFEDPTGGLAAGPAEEMTSAEVETHVRLLVPAYTPDLYRLLFTPFVDVMFVIVSEGLVPEQARPHQTVSGATTTADSTASSSHDPDADETMTDASSSSASAEDSLSPSRRPEQLMVRWFTDGVATLKNPDFTREGMGDERWRRFCQGLQDFCEPMESVQPVTRTARKYGLRDDLFVPLMRQIALNLVEPDTRKATIASLPGFILGMANGRAPASLGLPHDHAQRVQAVAEMFLSTGQETGNADLAYLGIQLVRANDMAVPYRFQKQLTNVFAASARIKTDWQFRLTGQLVEVYPRWLDYFRKVASDNAQALERQKAQTENTRTGTQAVRQTNVSTGGGGGGDEDAADGSAGFSEDEKARDYFASHRRDDVQRSHELQANVEAAVETRAPLLAPWLQRGARKRHTTPPALRHTSSAPATDANSDQTTGRRRDDDSDETDAITTEWETPAEEDADDGESEAPKKAATRKTATASTNRVQRGRKPVKTTKTTKAAASTTPSPSAAKNAKRPTKNATKRGKSPSDTITLSF